MHRALDKYDDAIDSDRKVWTSIAIGTAAGAVAGALVARDDAGVPWRRAKRPAGGLDPASAPATLPAGAASPESRALLARVRAVREARRVNAG